MTQNKTCAVCGRPEGSRIACSCLVLDRAYTANTPQVWTERGRRALPHGNGGIRFRLRRGKGMYRDRYGNPQIPYSVVGELEGEFREIEINGHAEDMLEAARTIAVHFTGTHTAADQWLWAMANGDPRVEIDTGFPLEPRHRQFLARALKRSLRGVRLATTGHSLDRVIEICKLANKILAEGHARAGAHALACALEFTQNGTVQRGCLLELE